MRTTTKLPITDLAAKHVPSRNGVEVGRAVKFLLPLAVLFSAAVIIAVHVAVSGRI